MMRSTTATADVTEQIRSPLTGSLHVSLVKTIPTSHLIHQWLRTYRIDIADEFHGLDEIRQYRCNQTGLIFFRPVTIAGSPRLYRQLQTATEYYSALKWEHHRALKDLRCARVVLEIGCGAGAFVKHARQAGIEASGIDVNPDAVAQARSEGLPVQSLDLQTVAREHAGQFDAVCSFQVLEHTADPGEFLRNCLRLLKPGGTLIASVPNSEGFLRYYDELLDLPPHHMTQWNRATFEALQSHFGVRLAICLPEPLAANHVEPCVSAWSKRLRSRGRLGAALASRRSSRLMTNVLQRGGRYLVRGHTLYARFVRLDW
jgi:2-polyprenyl-3-methyl-5-hydroxy-6-metoxy-1,4-benzoquinol methylase